MRLSWLVQLRSIVLLSVLACGFCPHGDCHAQSIDSEIARVEENLFLYNAIAGESPYTLAERMEHYNVPGVSIAVIQDFAIRWVVCYGVASAETAEPVMHACPAWTRSKVTAPISSARHRGWVYTRRIVPGELTASGAEETQVRALSDNHEVVYLHAPQ